MPYWSEQELDFIIMLFPKYKGHRFFMNRIADELYEKFGQVTANQWLRRLTQNWEEIQDELDRRKNEEENDKITLSLIDSGRDFYSAIIASRNDLVSQVMSSPNKRYILAITSRLLTFYRTGTARSSPYARPTHVRCSPPPSPQYNYSTPFGQPAPNVVHSQANSTSQHSAAAPQPSVVDRMVNSPSQELPREKKEQISNISAESTNTSPTFSLALRLPDGNSGSFMVHRSMCIHLLVLVSMILIIYIHFSVD